MRKSKGYAKGGAKMMKARGGKMAKGYAKGGAKMMRADKGGFTDPAKFLKRAKASNQSKNLPRAISKKAISNLPMTKKANMANIMKEFNKYVGSLPLPTSRKALVKKGIRKLVMPAMKNLGTVKASKVKTIKSVRGMKKK